MVEAAPAVGEPAAVAPDHLDIGQEMVPQRYRLGDLEMGEAGHHPIGIRRGLIDQRRLQIPHRRIDALDRAAYPEAEIGRDLVVARARGVQAPGNGADQLGKPRLDVEVDVFVRLAEHKGTTLDLAADLL